MYISYKTKQKVKWIDLLVLGQVVARSLYLNELRHLVFYSPNYEVGNTAVSSTVVLAEKATNNRQPLSTQTLQIGQYTAYLQELGWTYCNNLQQILLAEIVPANANAHRVILPVFIVYLGKNRGRFSLLDFFQAHFNRILPGKKKTLRRNI